jgi:AraC family transcriptional regulator
MAVNPSAGTSTALEGRVSEGVDHRVEPTFGTLTANLLPGVPISYRIERHVNLPCGFVEIGQYEWWTGIEKVVAPVEEFFTLNFALSPRPSNSTFALPSSKVKRDCLPRVMMIAPGAGFHFSVPRGKVRSLQYALDKQRLNEIAGYRLNFDESQDIFTRRSFPTIEFLLNRIHDELREERTGSTLAIQAYADALSVEIVRCIQGNEKSGGFRKGGLSAWQLQRLHDRIDADAPAPRLEELAAICGITVRHLSRGFKAETGKSLGRYIDQRIIERAGRLLEESDLTVAEIAKLLGFSSSASFSHAFSRSAGIMPSERRRRSRLNLSLIKGQRVAR